MIPETKGSHSLVVPDMSYIIFGKNKDLFIIYIKLNSTWTQPLKLNARINIPGLETNAFVIPDEKFMFITREFDIYWVDTKIIEELKPKRKP